jgi:hypothetical protein
VPRQAVFEKNGKNYVFVKVGERFEQRDVKVVNSAPRAAPSSPVCRGGRDRARRSDVARASKTVRRIVRLPPKCCAEPPR